MGWPSPCAAALHAKQLKVADPFELGIVGDPGGAIAEADLGADIERHRCSAVGCAALERLAAAELVGGEGPCHLGPPRLRRARQGVSIGRPEGGGQHQRARDGAQRERERHHREHRLRRHRVTQLFARYRRAATTSGLAALASLASVNVSPVSEISFA